LNEAGRPRVEPHTPNPEHSHFQHYEYLQLVWTVVYPSVPPGHDTCYLDYSVQHGCLQMTGALLVAVVVELAEVGVGQQQSIVVLLLPQAVVVA